MGPTHAEVMGKLPAERRERIAKRKAEMLREIDGLAMLRQIAERSQKEIAEKLKVKQPSVHQMERQIDLHLSTLRRYVQAAGADLELRITLPGHEPFKLVSLG